MAVAPDEETRSARKRGAIIAAARSAFLRQGYRGTSMDEITAAAGVSKQTVYKNFADKEQLFSQVVRITVDEVSDPVHDEVVDLGDSGDLAADLRDLARRQLRAVMQPQLLQLRRLVIAEADRFPELGRTFYDRGPGRTIASLAATFEVLGEHGLLDVDDPVTAADAVQLAGHVGAAERRDAARTGRGSGSRPSWIAPPTTVCGRSSPRTGGLRRRRGDRGRRFEVAPRDIGRDAADERLQRERDAARDVAPRPRRA